jgi:transcriptional regulator
MYQPSHFVETRLAELRGFVHAHPLATLVTRDRAGALQADLLPLLLEPGPTPSGTLRGHVARANPLWRETDQKVEALAVFHGTQGYISPAWYASKAEHGKVVPTWNYLLVQARGRLRAIEDRAWLHALVGRLTERFEGERAAKAAPAAWRVEDAPGGFVDTMLGAIVGIEIELTSLVGKFKLSQNRSAADRAGVLAGLHALAQADADVAPSALAMAAAVTRANDGAA